MPEPVLDRLASGSDKLVLGLDRLVPEPDKSLLALDRLVPEPDKSLLALDRSVSEPDRSALELDRLLQALESKRWRHDIVDSYFGYSYLSGYVRVQYLMIEQCLAQQEFAP